MLATAVAAVGLGLLASLKTNYHVEASVTNSQINRYIKKASLRDKIGQMFIARTPQNLGEAENDAAKYNLGGYIIYDADLQNFTQQEFASKMANYQKAARVPLLIGIDQEGGNVSRLTHSGMFKENGDQFKFPRQQYEDAEKTQKGSGMTAVFNYAKQNVALLHQLGINWNFAPDADFSNETGSFIYQRSFGQNYQETANYIKQVVPAWQNDNQVAATLKHFPGYGDAADTHTGFAHVKKSQSEIMKNDVLPFKAGINAGVDSVMVTHVIYNKIDPKYPASLSKKVDKLLRHNCHFKGVVVTDALEMGAIQDFAKKHHVNADVLAAKAGNDMIMSADYRSGIPAIAKAVSKKQIHASQINASVKRILLLKNKLGLLNASNLTTQKDKRKAFSLKNVKYKGNEATITGTARKNAKISLQNTANNQVVKTVKADKKGKFTITTSLSKAAQNYLLKSPGFISVDALLKAGAQSNDNTSSQTFTIKISYNKKNTIANISGSLADAGAEGSATIMLTDAKSGQIVSNAVVGKNGDFACQVPLLKKARQIKVAVEGDSSYPARVITIKAK